MVKARIIYLNVIPCDIWFNPFNAHVIKSENGKQAYLVADGQSYKLQDTEDASTIADMISDYIATVSGYLNG